MPRFIDRTGEVFGRLTVISRATGSPTRWNCRCSCGTECVVISGNLQSGGTTSCGCAQREATAASNTVRVKHGFARGHKPSPEWRSWKSMQDRCYLPSNPNYRHYGGKGIEVCDRWLGRDGFKNFFADMGARPPGKTLDRFPNGAGNYEPGNCRWATAKEQTANQTITPEGHAAKLEALARGRATSWADPEISARMVASRKLPRPNRRKPPFH